MPIAAIAGYHRSKAGQRYPIRTPIHQWCAILQTIILISITESTELAHSPLETYNFRFAFYTLACRADKWRNPLRKSTAESTSSCTILFYRGTATRNDSERSQFEIEPILRS